MLSGNKVALTQLRCEDIETLFSWINDSESVRFNAPYTPIHEPAHMAWFTKAIADPTRIIFGIRELSSGRIVGVIQLIDINPIHRSAELIIRIGDEADRNRGLGSEAVRLMIDFAFRDRNLQRIWLRVFADNPRAMRAYEKVGLQLEGILRRACFVDGRWRDQAVMAIVRELD